MIHLNFAGKAREALEYYAAAFDGQAVIRTCAEPGMPAEAPGADRVVFGQVFTGSGFSVMAYDVPGADASPNDGGSTRRENGVTITDRPYFLALQAASLEEATGYWEPLLEGSRVVETLAVTPWSAGFGMLADRYGVTWIISVVDDQH